MAGAIPANCCLAGTPSWCCGTALYPYCSCDRYLLMRRHPGVPDSSHRHAGGDVAGNPARPCAPGYTPCDIRLERRANRKRSGPAIARGWRILFKDGGNPLSRVGAHQAASPGTVPGVNIRRTARRVSRKARVGVHLQARIHEPMEVRMELDTVSYLFQGPQAHNSRTTPLSGRPKDRSRAPEFRQKRSS